MEAPLVQELEELAIETTNRIWGIPPSKLSCEITTSPRFGNIRKPQTGWGRMLMMGAIGWGGVVTSSKGLQAVAKAHFWVLVIHELTKAVIELISLHGLNHLAEDTYQKVLDQADHIEYEIWMMQAGPALYRQLLDLVPKGTPLSECFMNLSRCDPALLEHIMFQVIESPEDARVSLSRL